MSPASSLLSLSRSEDKTMQMLFPLAEPHTSNSFDDFFDEELYGGMNNEDTIKVENETDNCFAADLNALTNEQNFHHARVDQSKRSPLQPWRKGLWCLNQKLDACLRMRKTRKPANTPPSNISPAFLATTDDNSSLSSPNACAQAEETKSINPTRLHKQRDLREMNHSPSLMYSQPFLDGGNDHMNAWQQDFQNFNIHAGDEQPEFFTYSTPSENLKYNPDLAHHLPHISPGMEAVRAASMHNISQEATYGRNDIDFANSHSYSAIMDSNLAATTQNMFSSTPDQNDAAFKFITEDLPSMSDWTTESMHSSNSSHNSNFSHSSFENSKHGMYQPSYPATRWSPSKTAMHSQTIPAPEEHYSALVQPRPRRATHNVLRYYYGGDDGLGPEYSSPEEVGIAISYHPPELLASAIPSAQSAFTNDGSSYINALASYPPLPPPVHCLDDDDDDDSPFTTPRRRNRGLSRTPSPSLSPTHRSSRSLRQRSPSRRDPSQHRRKSMHRAGPIKDGAETPRHRSLSRPPRTPKTPKTPSDGFASIGFVNFTPKDAAKLLNDVAPSGSSKTRARREQEARDKRKKLSEAAINAVRNAGGDVAALQRAILT